MKIYARVLNAQVCLITSHFKMRRITYPFGFSSRERHIVNSSKRLRDASITLPYAYYLRDAFGSLGKTQMEHLEARRLATARERGGGGGEGETERRVNLEIACCARSMLVYEIPPCCFQAGANHHRPCAIRTGNGRER